MKNLNFLAKFLIVSIEVNLILDMLMFVLLVVLNVYLMVSDAIGGVAVVGVEVPVPGPVGFSFIFGRRSSWLRRNWKCVFVVF